MNNLIVSDPGVLGGKPCIKGTRISVEVILELLASGIGLHCACPFGSCCSFSSQGCC